MLNIELVKQFMKVGGQDTPSSPTVPNEATLKLRFKLNLEEEIEGAEALGKKSKALQILKEQMLKAINTIDELIEKDNQDEDVNWPKVMDALVDKEYVNLGQVISYGLNPTYYNDSFKMVHKCNMSKFCNTEIQAIETVKQYKELKNMEVLFKEVDGKFVIYNPLDHNKVLKSMYWVEPTYIVRSRILENSNERVVLDVIPVPSND